jgi:hypothetical protein
MLENLSDLKLLITKDMVEAAGVELFRALITRNLLILGTATTAKKAPLPDPLYVYCTKMLTLYSLETHTATTVSHRFGLDREKTPSFGTTPLGSLRPVSLSQNVQYPGIGPLLLASLSEKCLCSCGNEKRSRPRQSGR